jgi:hypothetical protein
LTEQERKKRISRTAEPRYHAMKLLLDQGVGVIKAAEMLGYSPRYAYNLAKKAKDLNQNESLVSDTRVRRAHGVVDKLMRGKAWGDIKDVKDSTALRAAETVIDRHEPKAQEQHAPSISFTNINLNMAREDGQNPPIKEIEDTPPVIIEPEKVGL